MEQIGELILAIIKFLTEPTWHLVLLFIILLIPIAYSMIKEWGFTNKS